MFLGKTLRRVCPGGRRPYLAINACEACVSCAPPKSVSKTTTSASFNAFSTAGVRHLTPTGSAWNEPNKKTLPLGPSTLQSAGASTCAAASRVATGENARLSAARLAPTAATKPRSPSGGFMFVPGRYSRSRNPAMDLELALGAHRDLGDRRRVAAVSHELSDAAMHTGRQRFAPVALLGRRVQDTEVLRVIGHQLPAEFKRVFPGRARHFLHEA